MNSQHMVDPHRPPTAQLSEQSHPQEEGPMTLPQLFFSLRGRIPRSTYWLKYFLPYVALYIIAVIIDNASGMYNESAGAGVFSSAFMLIAFYPSLAVTVKRCHDRDHSGWFLLIGFIPILGAIWLLIELGFLRGTIGLNRYGADPLPHPENDTVLESLESAGCLKATVVSSEGNGEIKYDASLTSDDGAYFLEINEASGGTLRTVAKESFGSTHELDAYLRQHTKFALSDFL